MAVASTEHLDSRGDAEPPAQSSDPVSSPTAPSPHAPGTLGIENDLIEPTVRGFWEDALLSFVFFLDAANAATFAGLCVVYLLLGLLNFAPAIDYLTWLGQLLLGGWLCAFYLNIVAETARGEDDLPSVSISDYYEDLLRPLGQFAGCWLIVLLPAGVLALLIHWQYIHVSWKAVWVAGGIGMFFWPIIVLGAVLGEGVTLGSIPWLLLTVARIPVEYLMVCILVAAAALVAYGAYVGLDWLLLSRPGAAPTFGKSIAFDLVASLAQAYACVVAMRLIGLLYRHYKARFPWVAE